MSIAYLSYTDTPLNNKNKINLSVDAGKSINQCKKIICKKLGLCDFAAPTICIHNGKPILRKYWDNKIKQKDHINFVVVVGFSASIGVIAASLALSVASTVLLKPNVDPPKIETTPEPDPVYTLRGQRNKIRPNDPIEEIFGRCKVFPSFASKSYTKYINNEQFLFSLFCIGQGEYETEPPMIDDTPVAEYPDFNYEIYSVNDEVTLFRDNVETSNEVSNINIIAPNEEGYLSDNSGYHGWYIANDVGTLCDQLELDLVYPEGLYYQNSNGSLSAVSVTLEINYQQINDDGEPIGSIASINYTQSLTTTTPQRFTFEKSVTPGRYQVRVRRTTDGDESLAKKEKVVWETLRAFLPNVGTYEGVTTIATQVKASNVTGNADGIFNLFVTRKLPVYDGTNWSTPVATRSAVWAFCHILRSNNGANIDNDEYLKLDAILETEKTLVSENRNFDWVFDTKTTVWQALQLVSRAVRGFPVIQGYSVNLKLERPQEIPTAIFNAHNIVKDSLRWEIKLKNENDYDGVKIEYIDPESWKTESIECYLPDSMGNYLKPLKLPGVTNRNIAYIEGMYEVSKDRYNREMIIFETGLEGCVPEVGDIIQVSHELPQWGQGGRITSIDDNNIINTDTSIVFEDGEEYRMQIKTKNGDASSYYSVKLGDNDKQLVSETDIDINHLNLEFGCEDPIFILGKYHEDLKIIVVNEITKTGEETVEINGFNYDSRVFDFDDPSENTVEEPVTTNLIATTASLEITGLSHSISSDAQTILIRWDSLGATFNYQIQYGSDPNNFSDTIASNYNTATLYISYLPMYYRIASVSKGVIGAYSPTQSITIDDFDESTPIDPTGITITAGYGSIQIAWDYQPTASNHIVEVTTQDPTTSATWAEYSVAGVNNYTLNGLKDNTTYYARVKTIKTIAKNELESDYSDIVNATTHIIINGTYYSEEEPTDPGLDGAVWFEQDNTGKTIATKRWDAEESKWVDVTQITTQAEIKADSFAVKTNDGLNSFTPFVTIGNQVFINNAFVQNVNANKIESGSIDSATITLNGTNSMIQSSNFISGQTGFSINGNGDSEFNSSYFRGNIIIDEDNGTTLLRSDAQNAIAVPNPTGQEEKVALYHPYVNEDHDPSGLEQFSGASITFYGRDNTTANILPKQRLLNDNHIFHIRAVARMAYMIIRPSVWKNISFGGNTVDLGIGNVSSLSGYIQTGGNYPVEGSLACQIDDQEWQTITWYYTHYKMVDDNSVSSLDVYFQKSVFIDTVNITIDPKSKITFKMNFPVDLYYSNLLITTSNW